MIPRKFKKFFFRDYFGDKIKIRKRLDFNLMLRYGNWIDKKLILGDSYEKQQLRYFGTILGNESFEYFLDVGANFGLYSLFVARNYPEIKNIIAFEPDSDNYCHLCGNLFLNNYTEKITVYNIGISNYSGDIGFLKNKGESTGHSRIIDTAPDTTRTENFELRTIKVETLDNTFQIRGSSLALKIDVEGHEVKALEGASDLICNNKCFIQIECFGEGEKFKNLLRNKYGLKFLRQIESDYYFTNFF